MQNRQVKLNPNIHITREATWQKTLEKVVPQLLVDAQGQNLLGEGGDRHVSVTYYYQISESEDNYALRIIASNALVPHLANYLNAYFSEDKAAPQPCVSVMNNETELVIPHKYIPRFFNEICGAVSLYANNHYSLVRDFYCVAPEITERQGDKRFSAVLNETFDKLHRAYQASEKMQTQVMTLAHRANGFNQGASLFKAVHPSVSSQDELYQRLNALVHAYHLGELGENQADFSNKLQAKDERARLVEDYGDGLLTLVHYGDMFYEISKAFKDNPDATLVYVSPDNLFRCGSAALVGNRGSVEESLVRVSNYVPQALDQAELDAADPQLVLRQLYASLQPSDRKVRLGAACGVYYLTGQVIPEYIEREDVWAYSEFAYERLHLAREMANKRQFDDKYPRHKTNPHLVKDVKFLDASGVVRSVNVMGMVGIDGKLRHADSLASKIGFDDSSLQDQHGFDEYGRYSEGSTINFYLDQWSRAFFEILNANIGPCQFILNPVGCGAFDPSTDGSMFSKASAQGFALALKAYAPGLKAANVSLVLPIYDMRKVYPHYRNALFDVFKLDAQPQALSIGGTADSCVQVIAKKYHESKGGKFEVEKRSLKQIVEHAIYKDSKTRRVLLALNYLSKAGKNGVKLSDASPEPVRAVYGEIVSQAVNSEFVVKAGIVAAYKSARGFIYKSSQARMNGFDIFSASLQEIVAHAVAKDGNTRRALINLNYVEVLNQAGTLTLVEGDHVPQVFSDAFNAAVMSNQPQFAQ